MRLRLLWYSSKPGTQRFDRSRPSIYSSLFFLFGEFSVGAGKNKMSAPLNEISSIGKLLAVLRPGTYVRNPPKTFAFKI